MGWASRTITSRLAWLAALLLVGLGVTWWQVTERAVDAVEIRTVGVPECSGTTVDRTRPRPRAQRVSAIRLTPEMSCRVTLEVANTGRLPVFLHDLVLPLMGPDGGAAVQVRTVVSGGQLPVHGEVAAEVPLDRRLDAEDSFEIEVVHTFRRRGCTADGGLFWVPAAQLEPSLLWRSTVVQADSIHFAGTVASAC